MVPNRGRAGVYGIPSRETGGFWEPFPKKFVTDAENQTGKM